MLRWGLATVLLLLLLPAESLRADSRLGDYTVTSWTVENGLPNNSVTCLLQSHDGYLWIGTAKGLVRFDGQTFQPVNLSADDARQPDEITALFEDTSDQLWIGTRQDGLWCLASENITRVNGRDGFNCPAVTCIAGDPTGDLWVGTTNGMNWFRGTNMLHVTTAQGLPSGIISSIRVSGPSAVWITTHDGMCQFTNGVLSPLELETDSAGRNPEMIGMFNDQHGNLWAFGDTYLVNLNDGTRFNYFRSGDTTSLRIWSSCEGRDGQLWIGTSGQGLFSFADGRFRPLSLREASLGSDIQSILEDNAGDLWLGTFSSGLVLLQPQRVQTLDVSTGLPSEMANCLAASPDGRIWAGYTDEGLFFRQSEHFERCKVLGGRDSIDLITSLAATPNGELWAGTMGLGLVRFKDGFAARLTTENGLSDDEILAVAAQSDGSIWAGMTDGSIDRVSEGRLQCFDRKSGLFGSPISCILAGSMRTIIAGTENGWLGRLTNGCFVSIDPHNTLAGVPIRALFEDAAGRLWIGTQGKGLAVLAGGCMVYWDDKHGFPDNEVDSILSDDKGCLWFETRQGIHVLSPASAGLRSGLASQAPALQTVKRFERSSLAVARRGWPQAVKGSDGRLWFAGPNGICVLDPHDFQSAPAPFEVELENILVDGEPRTGRNHFGFVNRLSQPLRLPANLRSLEIDFTAPCLVSPDQVQFQHRLDNLDKDWVDSGSDRRVRYNGLPLGEYQFHVRARNLDGTWGRENSELAFILPPPFWRLPLVISFELLLVVALVAAAARLFFHRRLRLKLARLSHQEAMERERMRIARDMHDEIGSRLTRISYVSELALQDGATHQSVLSISHAVHDLLKSLDEIVWAVNPQNDTLENLAAYLGHYATEYLHATAVECKLDIEPSLPLIPLTAETRHNIFLAFEEALGNALRHSNATCLGVDIHYVNEVLEIRVEDNGKGFPSPAQASTAAPESAGPERRRKGNGLVNMRQRLSSIGGTATVESRSGQGTIVTFRLPLKPVSRK